MAAGTIVQLVLFEIPNTTNPVFVVLIVVVLIAAADRVEVLLPRVVLWIVRVLGRTPVVTSYSKVFTSQQGVLLKHDFTTQIKNRAVPLRFQIKPARS